MTWLITKTILCSVPLVFNYIGYMTVFAEQTSKWPIWCCYSDVITGTIASQITSVSIIYLTVSTGADQNIKAPRHWPLWGEFTGDRWIPPGTGEFLAQMASNAENVSIWWRHHVAGYRVNLRVNSSRSSNACMCLQTGPSLIHTTACGLFLAEPLSKLKPDYC